MKGRMPASTVESPLTRAANFGLLTVRIQRYACELGFATVEFLKLEGAVWSLGARDGTKLPRAVKFRVFTEPPQPGQPGP